MCPSMFRWGTIESNPKVFAKKREHKTRNQLRVAIGCHKGVKVKVVKWC